MNIEESIEILESYKESLEEYEDNPRIIQAIETLLTAYEKEKENNKELRKYYATRKEVEELREINECLHDSSENYIHKNKVIEKVKEIKDEFKEYENGQEWEIQDEIRGQIEVLESLLEKE